MLIDVKDAKADTYLIMKYQHNIIQVHNNVMWDWMWEYLGIICGILLVPHNIVMDMNNVVNLNFVIALDMRGGDWISARDVLFET